MAKKPVKKAVKKSTTPNYKPKKPERRKPAAGTYSRGY